jgi:UDP-N-acetylglucosamine--N-acetylmuramyl-(pentapeptide) pyrophosphoryl-undecaprenol N-acetylglucosamine transferase
MFPAKAFAEEMRRRGWRIGLVTDARGLRFAEGFPADWIGEIEASSISLRSPAALPRAALRLLSGFFEARRRIARERPLLAIGFGGYPAFPALAAATACRVPIVIHEQNAVLGRVNRFFASGARVVACAFERLDHLPSAARDRKKVVGNPVRDAIRAVRSQPYPPVSSTTPLRILVTGGSQGAQAFGVVVPEAMLRLPDDIISRLLIVQQARPDQLESIRNLYQKARINAVVEPFFSDMHERLGAAHLVIGRAGASTVSELALVGRPSILIPLAIAMDDHQTANAQYLAGAGAADVIAERDFQADKLATLLRSRLTDLAGLPAMAEAAHKLGRPDAAGELADIACAAAKM